MLRDSGSRRDDGPDLKPWLIEVNHSPSFTTDTPLDLAVKEDLISDTIDLVGIDAKALAKMEEKAKADAMSRLFAGKWTGSRTEARERGWQNPRGALTDEAREALRECEKWEEEHSGSYEIVSFDGSRASGYVRAAPADVQGTVGDQGPAAQPQPGDGTSQETGAEESDETEVPLFKDGRRQPTGDGWKKVIDMALENKNRTGRVGDVAALASVARTASGGDKGGWWRIFVRQDLRPHD